MKKFISLALTLAMVVAMVPMTAFASSDNKISGSITGENDQVLDKSEAPELTITNDEGDWKAGDMTFELTLENAEWTYTTSDAIDGGADHGGLRNGIQFKKGSTVVNNYSYTVEKKTASTAIITLSGDPSNGNQYEKNLRVVVPLYVKLTGGAASVTIVPKQSQISADTYTFAKGSDGGTVTTIEKTTNFADGDNVKPIFVEEVAKGAIDAGSRQLVTVRLSSGFKFKWSDTSDTTHGANYTPTGKDPYVTVVAGDTNVNVTIPGAEKKDDQFKFYIDAKTTKASQFKIDNLYIYEDGANYGDVATITVSGAGVGKEKVEAGTYSDFGIKLSAEDKELPVLYSGRHGSDIDSEAEDALKVTFEETIATSWLTSRKTEFKLQEGVKFTAVDVKKADKITGGVSKVQQVIDDAIANDAGSSFSINKDDLTVINNTSKGKIEMVFSLAVAADFTGDIDLTVTGTGVNNEELTATIATAVAPFTVTTKVNEVSIDYRNVKINDIVITETEAGLLEKDSTLVLQGENMRFEDTIDATVDGDLKVDTVKVKDSKNNNSTSRIEIKIDSASSKSPSSITLSNVQLYLDRTLPAGDYKLSAVPYLQVTSGTHGNYSAAEADAEAFFKNYNDDKDTYDDAAVAGFDVDDVVMLKDFVKVVTAGRDQDDSTFTTKIIVPIGANEITAGETKIALDSPAYITGAGYTMLPVRAITEALSGIATVRWDDSSKTCTISFGQRIISMSVGKNTMNINGVETALQAPPEITNERIFLPLRDLGYALGLNDSKIGWDPATSTATLN